MTIDNSDRFEMLPTEFRGGAWLFHWFQIFAVALKGRKKKRFESQLANLAGIPCPEAGIPDVEALFEQGLEPDCGDNSVGGRRGKIRNAWKIS